LVKPDGTDLVDIAVINSNYDKIDANIASTKIQATKPATANAGDLWWDSNTGTLYLYYTDANSSQWVAATSDPVNIGVVANQSERDAQYPTPGQGMRVWRQDIGAEETYYGLYNVSTNPAGRTPAGWYRADTITPFANAAARAAVIPSPTEGMVSYLADADTFDFYNGSAWSRLGPSNKFYQASSMNVNPIPVAALTLPNSTQTITVPGSGYTTIIMYGSGMQMNIAMSVALRLWVDGSNVNTIESSVQNGFFRYGNHSSYAANLPAGNHTINLSVEASSAGVSVCYNAYWTAFVVKN
jgi:hypothetical protein